MVYFDAVPIEKQLLTNLDKLCELTNLNSQGEIDKQDEVYHDLQKTYLGA